MKIILAIIPLCIIRVCLSQDHSFPFGEVTYQELEMTVYEKDTAASAVVLNEFGEAFIDNANDHNLILQYHVKIKILKKAGLEQGNISIPLHKGESSSEKLRTIKASSFNIENGSVKETKLSMKNVYTENRNKYWDVKKIAIPNVQVGSVIEIQYELESPFIFNFRSWNFQSDIPKVSSEYWAIIPANYRYNIALKGFLNLSKNEHKVLKDYFTPGGGRQADCAQYMWAMNDIPAFIEEDFMTAKSNFLAAINFELSEIKYFDGRTDKVTKEWKDADQELRTSDRFGLQIKRGKDVVDQQIEAVIANETDPLAKAQKIYNFIRQWYRWDELHGKYSEHGIKKAFEKREGNVGDINLSLVAALRYAGFHVEPMILSTRENGLVTELYPVLSDFNYVVAKLNLNDKVYLLDATDDFLAFGLLPERCLNGKGRVLGEKQSYWYDINPVERAKQLSMLSLTLGLDGKLQGTIQTTYIGYKAAEHRRKIYSFNSEKEYIKDLDNKWSRIDILNHEFENLEDFEKPFIEKLSVEIEAYENLNANHFLFNPFVIERWERNPFKSTERLFPVDFGAPLEEIIILNLKFPKEFELAELPERVGLALPNAGGRFILDIQNTGNSLALNHALLINKTVFTSEEYHYLKELFNRVVQAHNADLIFRKKR